jgi:prevent-host-death family protein
MDRKKASHPVWRVAEAKQRFSEVIRKAAQAPQQILSRDRPVAAVIDAEAFREFEEWRRRRARPIADDFAELRRIAAEEGYTLKVKGRTNRRNPLPDALTRANR